MIIQKLLLPLLIASSAFAADMKPNVVLIYADDMGYGEVEALNPERSKVPTPSLNALAAEGMILLIGICFLAALAPPTLKLRRAGCRG